MENNVGKLYYWDENSGSAYIRYWIRFGDPRMELNDLSEDRVRHVYYTDQTGEVITPWNFKVVERTFLTDEHHVMIATVETSEGKRHITLLSSAIHDSAGLPLHWNHESLIGSYRSWF